jgi:glycosyltransferase involved in cell wall biosynthesis
LITSVHDLSFELLAEYQQKGFTRLMRDNLLTVARHSSALICFSRTTKKIFTDFAEKNNVEASLPVAVIPHGIDHICRGTDKMPSKVSRPRLPYFLYTGALDKDKNINRMVLGFLKATQNRDLRLVLAGPEKRGSGIRKSLLNHKKIQYLGYVNDNELKELYTAAECFITASLDEGFGLCPLEAMRCGTPVICSDIGCFRETLKDRAIFFDPYDTDDIADKIRLFLKAPLKQRNRIITDNPAEVFSWRDSARQTLELYRSIL